MEKKSPIDRTIKPPSINKMNLWDLANKIFDFAYCDSKNLNVKEKQMLDRIHERIIKINDEIAEMVL